MYLGLIVAFVALVLPGVYLYAAWSVALQVLVIEGLGAGESLRRSRDLVKGRWWSVAGVVLAMTLITILLSDGLAAVVLAVFGRGPTVLSSAAITNGAIAIGAIITNPFHSSVGTVLYYGLHTRDQSSELAVHATRPPSRQHAPRKPRPSLGPPPGESA
jgi:hypothetical protein